MDNKIMSSRKRRTHPDDMEKSNKVYKKRHRPRLKLEDAPPVHSISDLIEIGKSIKFYKNLDTVMLWRITPYLEDLDKMIGMESLKETVFFQVIYYLQNMHVRNQNEEYLHTLILGPPGHGKCLKIGTPLIMYDGSVRPVQDIKIGDLLMGDDSTPRKVLSTCKGRETMYEIEQSYGDNYTVNASHILSLKLSKAPRLRERIERMSYQVVWHDREGTRSKTFPYEYSTAVDVREQAEKFCDSLPPKGTVIDIPILEYLKRTKSWKSAYKGYKVPVNFEKKKIDLDPYFLGLWLGDGASNGRKIITNDLEIVDYLRDFCSNNQFVLHQGRKTGKNRNDMHYTIQDPNNRGRHGLLDSLQKYNLIKNKHIPDDYKYTNKNTRLQLLAGLIDSDGHLFDNCYDIVQKRKDLADDILWLTRSLGFQARLRECKKSCTYNGEKKAGTYYRIIFSGNTDEIPCKIPRKQASPRKQIKDPLVYGIKIRELPEDDYYGFTLDGNHRFVLGDFTVTHNTEVAKIIGKIYQAMGILSRSGSFRIAHRDDFIAEYLGQTAIKTKRLLKSCIGGVLFIDEVYSLAPARSDRDSFAKEALDTLTAFLSEHKNDFCCIAAGYEEDVQNCFFAMNKGLERRFTWVHRIDAYSPVELTKIFMKMIEEMKWDMAFQAKDMETLVEQNKDMFKNAGGDIETFISKCKMMHSRRVFSLGKEHRFVLTKEDLEATLEYLKKHSKVKEQGPPPHMYT